LPSGTIPVEYIRNRRARRYILRVTHKRVARLTLPRWGSKSEAYSFAQRQALWIEKQLARSRHSLARPWTDGTLILFRGERISIQIDYERQRVCFADEQVSLETPFVDPRPVVERRLREIAVKELIPRAFELARIHQLTVRRVFVRDQKTRWGSCSIRGTISLNWRLIQAPPFVADYLIIHELMHLREMNHSARYWRHVAEAFSDYCVAERWLKENSRQLMP
jgi:predicted metal-dependent hydrolase